VEKQAASPEKVEPVTEDQIVSESVNIMDMIQEEIDGFLDNVMVPKEKPALKSVPPAPPVKGAKAAVKAPAKKGWGSYTPPATTPYSWASTKFDDGYLQPSGMTKEERYPKIYDSAAKMKPKAKRVLSFGCSTGEEAFALAKRFPNAEQVVGVDLDINRIRDARKASKEKNVFFYDTAAGLGQFDVVTALNVFFCLEKPIPKDIWTKTLEEVASYVTPGGILMIFKSDYDPAEFLGDGWKPENVWVHKHNRNNKDYFCGYYKKNKKPLFWF
jgi:SAM-dependent methyltransferase